MNYAPAGWSVLAYGLLALAACDGVVPGALDGGTDGAAIPEAGAYTSALCGPDGGSYSFYGGRLILEVPPGALTSSTPIGALIPRTFPRVTGLVTHTTYDMLPDGLLFKKIGRAHV